MALERKAGCVLYQGEDKNIVIRLINEEDETPYNLNNASDMKALFRNEDGTGLVKTKASGDVTLVNAGNALQVRIRANESVLLKVGENQTIEVHVIDNGYLSVAQLDNALTVKPSLFPGL